MNRVAIYFRFCLVLILAFAWNNKANSQGSPSEEMYLHIDRDKYIAGEYVWFSIYTTRRETGRVIPESVIAYVELINPWNVPVIQARFRLAGGKGEGAFLLPDSISSGTYLIRAYTNTIKNFLPDNCFMQDINVYNPFQETYFFRRVNSGEPALDPVIVPESVNDNKIEIALDSIYETRQKIIMRLKMTDGEALAGGIAKMSISATLSDLVPARGQKRILSPDSPVYPERYKPEIDGHFLSFLVKYREDDKADSSDFLFMSIQGKVAEFNYAQEDTKGRFTFILPVDDRPRNLVIQPEHATGSMVLEMEPPFPGIFTESECIKAEMNDYQMDLFSALSFNYQASKIYGTDIKPATPDDDINLKKRRFYGIPEMEVLLDNYVRLPNMQEVFFELVPDIIIREKKTGNEIKIINPLTGSFYQEPPLIMIDGVIINDLSVLVDLDPALVEKIEVVKTPYLFDNLVLHGIVNVITREGNFSKITMPDYAVILPYRVVEKPPSFNAPEYSDEQKRSSRKPDLRNTLYWDPSVLTNIRGEAEVEFWTSDLPGKYTIIIQGITATGERIYVHRSFRVR